MERHYLQSLAPGYDKNEALINLMTEYGDDVWNFAYFLTRRSDAADDISQDVFLSAYNGLYAFRGECSVKSWLLGIARNKSLTYLKSAFIRKVTLVETVFPNRQSAPSAEKVAFDRMESREVWECIMKLPRKLREVLILDYHYGLSIREIARLLLLSEGTVKSRAFRARKRMSDLLQTDP